MFVIIGFHRIKPAHQDDYVRHVAVHAANSRAEAGCVRYEVLRDTADPAVFCLYEAFVDAEAAAVHRASAHHEHWMELSREWRDGPPVARWELSSVDYPPQTARAADSVFVIMGLRRIKREALGEYLEQLGTLVAATRAEPGCVYYEALRDNADPTLFCMYECFEDEAATRVHQHLPHHDWWMRISPPWRDGERVGRWELTSVSLA